MLPASYCLSSPTKPISTSRVAQQRQRQAIGATRRLRSFSGLIPGPLGIAESVRVQMIERITAEGDVWIAPERRERAELPVERAPPAAGLVRRPRQLLFQI